MSLSLAIMCPSMGGHEEAVTSWQDTMSKPWPIAVHAQTEGDDAGFLTKCNRFWKASWSGFSFDQPDIIGYLHSDLYILEPGWDQRVLTEFADPSVVVVGFVGATELGTDDIYRVKYDFRQLARAHVYSNLIDAEVHGEREVGSKQVAVIDSCGVFVRRQLLVRSGGWPVRAYPNSSHCSDLWLCCIARRAGLHVRMVGVACQHRSGGKGEAGSQWLTDRGGDHAMHQAAHVATYNEFKDVLPIRIRS